MKNEYGVTSRIDIKKIDMNKIKYHFEDMKGAFTNIEQILNVESLKEEQIGELIHLITYLRHFSLNLKNELLESVEVIHSTRWRTKNE